ncbi:MAG: ABC transporter ATP-binding protein [Campylobacterales bacterium]|nr:ABC transporter ATP-binding protein [Campylobacterales bacterium]
MQIKRLWIDFKGMRLVDIAFSIHRSLALVGQSGSGKSLTLKALLGMLPSGMSAQMQIEAPFDLVRGKSAAFVPQNPFTALSPMTRIEAQMMLPKAEAARLFESVGLEGSLLARFPSELSGGQLQRVILAMALSVRPKLLLLDEPTTALDPHSTKHIIELLLELQEQMDFAMLFVTHDIASASALCEELCVLRSGRVVEQGAMRSVMEAPQHEYTKTLIASSFASREFRV